MADREVVILGVGLHPFGRQLGKSPGELARVAAMAALKDAGVSFKDIQAGFCSKVNLPAGTGMFSFAELGMTGIPITNVEVACASCSRAVMLAADAIAGGAYDLALVIGVEKMPPGLVPISGDMSDMPYEFLIGLMPMPGAYAMMANRHMHLYETKREHFAAGAVKNHKNASLNPNAAFQKVVTMDEVLNSRLIADPITLYMSSANADGASAVVVCSKEKAKQYTTKPMYLSGWAGGTPVFDPDDATMSEGPTELLAKKIFHESGIDPKDVDMVQLHDAFSPAEIWLIEEMGLVPKGEGGPFVFEGNTAINGKLPVNTDGGLVGRWHPIGATGGAMISEFSWQFRGMSGQRQVKDPKVAMLENSGMGGMNLMLFHM